MINFVLADGPQSRGVQSFVAAGIIATGLLYAHPGVRDVRDLSSVGARRGSVYHAVQSSDTASVGGESVIALADEQFEVRIASFYEQLLSVQRPLESDFQAVLAENLWDLYA